MKLKKRIALSIVGAVMTVLGGCSSRPAEVPGEEQRVIAAYAELLILQEQTSPRQNLTDSLHTRQKRIDLLATAGFTQQQFTEWILARMEDPEQAKEFVSRLQAEVDARRSSQRK